MIKTCQGAESIKHEEDHSRRLLHMVMGGHEIICRLEMVEQKFLRFSENALFGSVLVREVHHDLGELLRGLISADDGVVDDADL